MKIAFSSHVTDKLHLLAERGFPVTKEQVLDCVKKPDKIDAGYKGRKIAQKGFDAEHVLRVVYTEEDGIKRIITCYPGRRERYEDEI
ncbi:MAG: DUF4258 domain-containing protein [Deltaproteobacteria bacterium]|nr:DUF4258 domain-containing protein [Deltaproteobacteria bacterium]